MKYPFVLTLVTCFALLAGSQTPTATAPVSRCSLKREQAPEIRGIRLGMPAEQLLTLFPEDVNRNKITNAISQSKIGDNHGVSAFDLVPDRRAPNPRMTGVSYITVRVLDERVTSFHIEYFGPEWKTIQQFVAKLSEGLRLPNSSWESADTSSQLNCDGFKIEAHALKGTATSLVHVVDTSVPQIVEARREAAREKVRQAFKP